VNVPPPAAPRLTPADEAARSESGLVPIDEVARQFGLRASAVRYYEERGLLQPASRRAGRRWYGPDEIRRLAAIRYWQTCGQMSLEEIADVLAGPDATREWAQIIQGRIDVLRQQAEQMNEARAHLEHVLSHHQHASPAGCSYYEALIFDPDHAHGAHG
jgi:DNA-binding transcriptional MerR regulator